MQYMNLFIHILWNHLFLLPDLSLMEDPGAVITFQYNLLQSVLSRISLFSNQSLPSLINGRNAMYFYSLINKICLKTFYINFILSSHCKKLACLLRISLITLIMYTSIKKFLMRCQPSISDSAG